MATTYALQLRHVLLKGTVTRHFGRLVFFIDLSHTLIFLEFNFEFAEIFTKKMNQRCLSLTRIFVIAPTGVSDIDDAKSVEYHRALRHCCYIFALL